MITTPVFMPDTTPDIGPTDAIVVLPLVQVPPTEDVISTLVVPLQMLALPLIAPTDAFTVTVLVA